MKVLVPGNMISRNVLAASRYLGRAGHEVILASIAKAELKHLDFNIKSRYVCKLYKITSPTSDPHAFVQDLKRIADQENVDVLLPITHTTVLPVSYYRDEFPKTLGIPVADYKILGTAHDKLETVKIAQRLNIPTPVTFSPANREDLRRIVEYIPFPWVIKARQACGIGTGIRFASNLEEAFAGYDEIHNQPFVPPVNDYSFPIVQEYVPGQIHDALYIYNHGVCRGALSQERVIGYPVSGGTGSVNTTTDDPELLELGKRLLDDLQWHGPCMVEFRKDPRDNQYKLMEINPKFWGTLNLSLAAGMDFVNMACELASTGDVKENFNYKVGLTFRWLFPDEIYSMLGAPVEHRDWKRFFKLKVPNTVYDFDRGDPVPDIYRIILTLGSLVVARGAILKAQYQYIDRAMQQSPAKQPEFGIFFNQY